MDKELLMNTVADVDFLLMITGFAIFMGAAALVLIVGLWEGIKDDRRLRDEYLSDYNALIKKHNTLVESVNNIATETIKMDEHYGGLIVDLVKAGKANSIMIRETVSMSNDEFNSLKMRLEELERYNSQIPFDFSQGSIGALL